MKASIFRRDSRPLPRGRHSLTREAVAASQRARLLDAMSEVVATKGYAATAVADVVARAGVSRRTFYELFADKEECFFAAYDSGVEFLLQQIRDALEQRQETDWRRRARASIEAYLGGLAARPTAAWVFSVEVLGAGQRMAAHRAAVLGRFIAPWRTLQQIARREDPAIAEASDDRLLGLVGGIEELVRECLRTRGAERLPELLGPATAVAISILVGPARSGADPRPD